MTIGSLSLKTSKKSKINGKNDTKCLKNAVKTAKKPILREKCAAIPDSVTAKRTETRGGLQNFKGKNHVLTPERARELSFKATEIKKVRAAARARLLDIALHKGQLENLFQAGLNGDTEAMAIAEKAAKMVGLDYQASPEASQKIELAGKLDNSLNVKIEKV